MVVVRESPRVIRRQHEDKRVVWPPSSPLQALLSSPGGRKTWEHRQEKGRQTSPSPSDKVLANTRNFGDPDQNATAKNDEGDSDEEEEILKLKLEQIEARLKLKQIQKARKTGTLRSEGGTGLGHTSTTKLDNPTAEPNGRLSGPTYHTDTPHVQIPVSPKRERNLVQEQLSPARKRLGLDSTLKAADVSLRRPRTGLQLSRHDSHNAPSKISTAVPKSLSFSERLSQAKGQSLNALAKQDRISATRTQGFGIHSIHGTEGGTPSSKSISHQRPLDPVLQRSNKTETAERTRAVEARAQSRFEKVPLQTTDANEDTGNEQDESLRHKNEVETSSTAFEPFSQTHLSKRHQPHTVVAREMESKEIYTIPRLFKEVVSPHYDPPDCESDFVVFAILASKSNPFDQKSARHSSDQNKPQEDAEAPRNKFMVLHLTDLKWDLDCFLFGTSFDQFWKLTPGTLVAILNPAIMPPRTNQHSGRFSLKLGSCEDKIMEIGVARDLGYCTSVKKDGQRCGTWVDKRHTEVCDFHLNLFVDKNRKHRMEVNSMWRGRANDEARRRVRGAEDGSDTLFGNNPKKRKGNFHPEYGQLYSVPGGHSKSAVNLLDAEDTDALHNMSRAEASRKRIANAEKERELSRKLAKLGGGVGAEYLRSTKNSNGTTAMFSTDIVSSNANPLPEKPSASELGLLANKAAEQHLSPAKDRKRHFGLGSISSMGSEAIGWGGARKVGLQPPSAGGSRTAQRERPEDMTASVSGSGTQDRSMSPRKRARFVLEQGIRAPGRESLGKDSDVPNKRNDEGSIDNEDDDLDIV